MIEIDGGQKSGSGTLVRDAVSLSVLTGEEIHLKNIRARRDKPGLRAQHLKVIEASAQICDGQLAGGEIGSKEVTFTPGRSTRGGRYSWDIGTAGSATALTLSLIPLALFADEPSSYEITGGLFQDFAPSVYHIEHVVLPILKRMGANIDLEIIQPGYVPEGKGCIEIKVVPLKERLKPQTLLDRGEVTGIKGIALSSLLKEKRVSERMAKECRRKLRAAGYDLKRVPDWIRYGRRLEKACRVYRETGGQESDRNPEDGCDG